MTAYIVMGVIVVGMGGLLLLVLHWDKKDHGRRRDR